MPTILKQKRERIEDLLINGIFDETTYKRKSKEIDEEILKKNYNENISMCPCSFSYFPLRRARAFCRLNTAETTEFVLYGKSLPACLFPVISKNCTITVDNALLKT